MSRFFLTGATGLLVVMLLKLWIVCHVFLLEKGAALLFLDYKWGPLRN